MSDHSQEQSARVDAAKAAAPYCHSRLQSITVQEKPFEGDPNELTNEYLAFIVSQAGGGNVVTAKKGSKVTH